MKNWKTTAAGVLSAMIGTSGPVAAYLATQHDPKLASAAGLVTLFGVVGRIWIGLIQSDAKPMVSSSVTIETTQPIAPAIPNPITGEKP